MNPLTYTPMQLKTIAATQNILMEDNHFLEIKFNGKLSCERTSRTYSTYSYNGKQMNKSYLLSLSLKSSWYTRVYLEGLGLPTKSSGLPTIIMDAKRVSNDVLGPKYRDLNFKVYEVQVPALVKVTHRYEASEYKFWDDLHNIHGPLDPTFSYLEFQVATRYSVVADVTMENRRIFTAKSPNVAASHLRKHMTKLLDKQMGI